MIDHLVVVGLAKLPELVGIARNNSVVKFVLVIIKRWGRYIEKVHEIAQIEHDVFFQISFIPG